MEVQKIDVQRILDTMLNADKFSEWLDLKIVDVKEGYSKITCVIRPEMLNGVGTVHGGITFSIADSAFAFACNAENNLSVALDVHMSYTKAGRAGDVFTAEAKELSTSKRISIYDIRVTNQNNELIALFKGTAFRTGKQIVEE